MQLIKADGGYDNPALARDLAAQEVELDTRRLRGDDGSFQPVDGHWRVKQFLRVLRHARRQVRDFECSLWTALQS